MKELIKRLLEAGKVDAETAETLTAEAEEQEGKLQSARDESIERRKKLKELEGQIKQLGSEKESILEAIGIDADEELDLTAVADKAKGKTEASERDQLKIKRLERDLETATNELSTVKANHQNTIRQAALSKALAKHDWVDAEVVEQVISPRIEVTDEGVHMDDGLSLEDGIAQFAAQKPHLLKAKGQGGSGYQKPNGGNPQQDYIP